MKIEIGIFPLRKWHIKKFLITRQVSRKRKAYSNKKKIGITIDQMIPSLEFL